MSLYTCSVCSEELSHLGKSSEYPEDVLNEKSENCFIAHLPAGFINPFYMETLEWVILKMVKDQDEVFRWGLYC